MALEGPFTRGCGTSSLHHKNPDNKSNINPPSRTSFPNSPILSPYLGIPCAIVKLME